VSNQQGFRSLSTFKKELHRLKSLFATVPFQMLAAFAEFERSMIRERQKEGIAKAKAKGLYKGRKRKVDYVEIRKAMAEENSTFRGVAEKFKVGIATVQRALKEETNNQ
ncbi:recombinase family protein, partial [Acinetobacter pittii]|uniref:recombinase family protein n=1 Tax=Acinetobacter pittii TaxID=48296 RepID=UPI00355B63ED